MIMKHILLSIQNMLEGFSAGTWYGKLAILAGTTLSAFYSPIVALLITCFIFTATDMVYGIKVAHKNGKKILSSRSWSGTLTKLLDELTIISLARLLEWSVLGQTGVFVLTGGATTIIALTELWSILENLNTLNPEGPWKALSKFLKKKGEDYIGTELNLKSNDDSNNPEVGSSKS